ncbi:hypothetical protein AVEN_263136-1 [Araneus ventricosus]|uniref:Uncharacterized protein n=1 Tax=Araneus ventricosus TaxID=182803 RepID=A0A4Y2F9Z8_ARAVE|nr:hypothetical protein AVEN_263136-1 [Araneus ventricosus]
MTRLAPPRRSLLTLNPLADVVPKDSLCNLLPNAPSFGGLLETNSRIPSNGGPLCRYSIRGRGVIRTEHPPAVTVACSTLSSRISNPNLNPPSDGDPTKRPSTPLPEIIAHRLLMVGNLSLPLWPGVGKDEVIGRGLYCYELGGGRAVEEWDWKTGESGRSHVWSCPFNCLGVVFPLISGVAPIFDAWGELAMFCSSLTS